MNDWALPGLLTLFLLDLGMAAARASFGNVRPLRMAGLPGIHPAEMRRTLRLVEQPRLRAGLRLCTIFLRFWLALLVYLWIKDAWLAQGSLPWVELLALALLAMILLTAEFGLEQAVLNDPERWALQLTIFGWCVLVISAPLTYLPLSLVKPQKGTPSPAQFTEDELKTWAEAEEQPGSLERDEKQMIASIFQFGDTLTREIMVPRIDIVALDVRTSLPQALEAVISSGHSRLPVYEATIDNILGLLYAKDLLKVSAQGGKVSLRDLLRPAYFVPETKKVNDLLTEMQSRRIHLGVVVDEYGGVAGLVTLEDIVEEIVGEIRDEYEPTSEELPYQEVSPGIYLFQGRIDLDDFNEVMGANLPKDEADTLAGYLYEQMGRVPQGGEAFTARGLTFTVEQVTGRRIRRVRVNRANQKEEKPEHVRNDR